ncbi:MAG: hypothetical protein IPK52_20605 [Chloroflexi bacterium]|nr:hypothetical protein [Chloroflexota bacterium]
MRIPLRHDWAEALTTRTRRATVLTAGLRVNSFSAETTVVTADGDAAISTISEGDRPLLITKRPARSASMSSRTRSHTSIRSVVVDPSTADVDDHRRASFYTTSGEWVDADDPKSAMKSCVWTATAMSRLRLWLTRSRCTTLTVDEAHTFFVGDGDWLVHNAGCGGPYQYAVEPENRLHPDAPTVDGIAAPDGVTRVRNYAYAGSNYQLEDFSRAIS